MNGPAIEAFESLLLGTLCDSRLSSRDLSYKHLTRMPDVVRERLRNLSAADLNALRPDYWAGAGTGFLEKSR